MAKLKWSGHKTLVGVRVPFFFNFFDVYDLKMLEKQKNGHMCFPLWFGPVYRKNTYFQQDFGIVTNLIFFDFLKNWLIFSL